MLAVVLCAFFFRVYNLSYESLDIDEADAVFFALADFPTLVGRMSQSGENGPLYFLLLRLWISLAGQSEFSLRFFSLLPGVLSVPLVYVLGRRLLGPRVGLTAAFLFSTSSYLLYYAQMVKMYSLVLFLSLLSAYVLLRALERDSVRYWTGYTVVTTAALYTHVFGALLVPWHGLFVLLNLRHYRAALVPWSVSLGALTLPYLPIGIQRLAAFQAPESLNRQFTGPQEPLGMFIALAREYGTRSDLLPGPLLSGLFLALTAGGLLALSVPLVAQWGGRLLIPPVRPAGLSQETMAPATGSREDHSAQPYRAFLFIGLGILVPLLAAALLVALRLPLFSSRYLIITLPLFYLLWAAAVVGLAARSRWLGLAALGVFVLLNGARWAEANVVGERFREDWRGAVAYLEQRYLPGDVLLVLHQRGERVVQYYATRPLSTVILEERENGALDRGKLAGLPSAERIWLFSPYFEAEEATQVQPWLDEISQPARQSWVKGIMINLYLAHSGGSSVAAGPLATFDGRLELAGYRPGPPPDRPGAPWQVTLEWRAKEAPLEPYSATLRLVDAQGKERGRSEGPVGGQFYPTERWPAGFSAREVREIDLAPGAPPGEYTLTMRVYRGDAAQPVAVNPSDSKRPGEYTLGVLKFGGSEKPQNSSF